MIVIAICVDYHRYFQKATLLLTSKGFFKWFLIQFERVKK
jgi:hypothetical protein